MHRIRLSIAFSRAFSCYTVLFKVLETLLLHHSNLKSFLKSIFLGNLLYVFKHILASVLILGEFSSFYFILFLTFVDVLFELLTTTSHNWLIINNIFSHLILKTNVAIICIFNRDSIINGHKISIYQNRNNTTLTKKNSQFKFKTN